MLNLTPERINELKLQFASHEHEVAHWRRWDQWMPFPRAWHYGFADLFWFDTMTVDTQVALICHHLLLIEEDIPLDLPSWSTEQRRALAERAEAHYARCTPAHH